MPGGVVDIVSTNILAIVLFVVAGAILIPSSFLTGPHGGSKGLTTAYGASLHDHAKRRTALIVHELETQLQPAR